MLADIGELCQISKSPVTVGVPEAVVHHPWWNNGHQCYKQITGWAWGDSMCITEWPEKAFLVCPNWVEIIFCILPLVAIYSCQFIAAIQAGLGIVLVEHLLKGWKHFEDATKVCNGISFRTFVVALGAGSALSSQEVTRAIALISRKCLFSFSRRVDWFDGSMPKIKLDIQLGSILRFFLYYAII